MRKFDDLLDELSMLEDADFGLPTSSETTESFELRSGIILPGTYKAFLRRFGGMSVLDKVIIAGISSEPFDILSTSKKLQEQWKMPTNLLILQPDEEAAYCFDLKTSGLNGEYDIVCYQLGKSFTKISNGFAEWIEEFVLFVYGEQDHNDS
jgi:hypothetical protein